MRSSTREAGSAAADPVLSGSEDEALIQALRNLWPILGTVGRSQAIDTAKKVQGD